MWPAGFISQDTYLLYLDDFPFFGSSLAHLEPELELFELDDIVGNDRDDGLSHHHLPNSCLGFRKVFNVLLPLIV